MTITDGDVFIGALIDDTAVGLTNSADNSYLRSPDINLSLLGKPFSQMSSSFSAYEGLYLPTVLQNVHLILEDYPKFENDTISDWQIPSCLAIQKIIMLLSNIEKSGEQDKEPS